MPAALSPIPVAAFSLIGGQKSVSGSPLGSPATTAAMLEFCARHGIETVTEHFPLSRVNDALDHRSGDDGLLQRFQIVVWPDSVGEWNNVDRWPDSGARNEAFRIFEALDSLNPSEWPTV